MTTHTALTFFATVIMMLAAHATAASGGTKADGTDRKALAEEAKLTALPFVSIETENGEKPTFTVVTDPYGEGRQAIKAEHVPARMVMTLRGDTIYDSGRYAAKQSGIRIKVRGNTSAMLFEQTPYKLKLSKKADLLFRSDKTMKSKDWALLSVYIPNANMAKGQSHLHTMFGMQLARLVGMDWEPSQQIVNVAINGEYEGMYNLCETIERDDARINVDDDGFVIENDAYWWNESKWFRTERQKTDSWMGYTFKYPDADDVTDSYTADLQDYMETVENAIADNDSPEHLIDFTSFAKWILAHDLLASADAAGTNIYYTKHDFDTTDYTQSPLKAGPLWDFGAAFKAPLDGWSVQHDNRITFYCNLFKNDRFRKTYTTLYNSVSATLADAMRQYLDGCQAAYGEAFDQSEVLQQRLISYDHARTFEKQKDELLQLLEQRIKTIGRLIDNEMPTNGIYTLHTPRHTTPSRHDITGRDVTGISTATLPHGVYIERGADGKTRKTCR